MAVRLLGGRATLGALLPCLLASVLTLAGDGWAQTSTPPPLLTRLRALKARVQGLLDEHAASQSRSADSTSRNRGAASRRRQRPTRRRRAGTTGARRTGTSSTTRTSGTTRTSSTSSTSSTASTTRTAGTTSATRTTSTTSTTTTGTTTSTTTRAAATDRRLPPDLSGADCQDLLTRLSALRKRIQGILATNRAAEADRLQVTVQGPAEPRTNKDFPLAIEVVGGAPPFRTEVRDQAGFVRAARAGGERRFRLEVEAPGGPGPAEARVRVEDARGGAAEATHRYRARPIERRTFVAGDVVGVSSLGVDSRRTAWEAAKQRLADLMRSYVTRDLTGMMRQFSATASPDPGVIRTAVIDDFQSEAQTNVDLVLRSYQETPGELCADATWNRTTVRNEQQGVEVTRGQLRVCFARDDAMKISLFQGGLPFGLHDAELRRQSLGGQLNLDPNSSLPAPDNDTASTPVVLLADPLGLATVAVDIEGGTIRSLGINPAPGPADALPGEDFFAFPLFPGSVTLNVHAIGSERVTSCAQPIPPGAGSPPAAVAAFGRVNLLGAGSTAVVDTASPDGPLFAYRTPSGATGVISYDAFTFVYNQDDDEILDESKSLSCP